MKPVIVHDVQQFVEQTLLIDDDLVLFRGQASEVWQLVPKLARLATRDDGPLLELETKLLAEFRSQSIPFLERDLSDDWDALAVAQHFGLATRLLDWTSNPLAALWFAVQDHLEIADAAVWALRPGPNDLANRTTSPFTQARTVLFQPGHVTRRITAQGGWFSVHKWNRSKGKFSSFDALPAYAPGLSKWTIPRARVPEIRSSLDKIGINEVQLFPDLDGLCNHLNWSHSIYPDEADGV